ncbi:MAG: SusC/RagA family TonB-linked outer membrane protein [Bacteroidia bacterium]|nr:SusC/RagA family TonB-linked outer membrane protein [Bacteroidia bacterium]
MQKLVRLLSLGLMICLLTYGILPAQTRNITGTVTGTEGDPLPGVNVVVKGTTIGTITDVEGNFQLSVPDGQNTLIFSFVGYLAQEVQIGNQSTVSVSMEEDLGQLQEVVVVGYGEQERAKVTGAIASISSEDIDRLPVASVDQALQGQAAGVTVINRGAPGENPLIRIRGIGTVNNNEPLYVIDGVPGGNLNSINPNDIASVEVLKDASTAAIYGSRAANGVILITTKKGQIGKPKVSIDAYRGVQNAWRQLDLLNREQYLAYGRDLFNNFNQFRPAGTPAASIPARFDNLGDFANVDTDWQDAVFQSALITDNNISVSGGNEFATYNVGGGYFFQEGIMLGTYFERISFRANSEYKVFDRLKLGQTLTLSENQQRVEAFNGGRSQIEHLIKSVPYIPIYDPTRLGGFRGPDGLDGSDAENPVLNATLRENINNDLRLLGTAYIDLDIYKGLKFRSMVGVDMNFARRSQFTPVFNSGTFHFSDRASLTEQRNTFIGTIYNFQLAYDQTFGDHTISAVAVYERQISNNDNIQASGTNIITDRIRPLTLAQEPNINGSFGFNSIISYVGRINYDFAGKYLFSASFRRDLSSRFSPIAREGFFPGFSAGWRISEEGFMEGLKPYLTELKIRGSYGETGNNRVPGGDWPFIPTLFGNTNYDLNGNFLPGTTVNRLANEVLGWETTKMLNIGFDAGFWENRLTLSLDWFKNTTEDLILSVPAPFSHGYDVNPIDNVGTVENTGIEILLGYKQDIGDVKLSFNGNFTYVTNELTDLGGGNTIFGPNFEGLPLTLTEEGQPIAYFYGFRTDGLFQSQAEIDAANAIDDDPVPAINPTPYPAIFALWI